MNSVINNMNSTIDNLNSILDDFQSSKGFKRYVKLYLKAEREFKQENK